VKVGQRMQIQVCELLHQTEVFRPRLTLQAYLRQAGLLICAVKHVELKPHWTVKHAQNFGVSVQGKRSQISQMIESVCFN